MVDFSVKIDGLEQIKSAFGQIPAAVEAEVAKAAYASAQQVASDYKKLVLAGGKSGRIYKRRSVVHQASAPGEAPASDTGRLVGAINVALDGTLSAVMKVSTAYAMLLEFGTSKMAARPAAIPALEQNKNWIADRFAQAVKAGIAKVRR